MIALFVFFLICLSPCVSEGGRRIYHGYDVPIQNYPHCVFLLFNTTRPSSCGASLVSAQAVLTAAHCVDELRYDRGSIDAYLGHVTPMYSSVMRVVVGYLVHPKYHEYNGRNNLAVAFFNNRVPLTFAIKKIPLTTRHPKDNDLLFSAGWGRQKINKYEIILAQMRNLRASKQKSLNISTCERLSGLRHVHTALCTMPVMGHMHIDDSGNGLVTRSPVALLVGVLSFVSQGVNIYTEVYINRSWILRAIYSLFRIHCGNKEKIIDKMYDLQ